MMKKRGVNEGITLIALVITIIVMLILSGVAISLTIGENGIFKKSDEGAQIYQNASNNEIASLNSGEQEMGNLINQYNGGETSTDNPNPTTEPTPTPIVPIDKSGASIPNLNNIAQKTYVTWNLNEAGTEYVINDTETTQPNNWYNYDNGEWANIKTTKENEKEDGTKEILEAYWVWIPRYEYIVPNSSQAIEIKVKFIPTSQKEADEGYTIHPVFTNEGNGGFGDLDGIWVAKFEASSNTEAPDSNYGGGEPSDTNPLKVQIKPLVQSWRNISVKNIFTVCRKMTETQEVLAGSTVDSHMMKNTEWGAVAILSQSKYGIYNPQSSTGKNGDATYQIWNNPYGYGSGATIKTGYVGSSKNAANDTAVSAPANVVEYNKIDKTKKLNGTKASTTGTVYGVYDMAGGSFEYVAGVLKGNSTDGSKDLEYATSIFNITSQGKPEGMTDLDFAKKYLDLYNYRTSNTDYSQYIIGDATVKTRWNNNYAIFVCSSSPIFVRGRRLHD